MAYYTHPDIESGKLIKAQDVHEMDEQIYENTNELTEHSSRIAQLADVKADKAVLSFFDRRMRYIYEHAEKQFFDIEDDTTEAYSKLLPSGVMGIGVNMIGGKSYVKNQIMQQNNALIYNEYYGMFSTVNGSTDKIVNGHKYLISFVQPAGCGIYKQSTSVLSIGSIQYFNAESTDIKREFIGTALQDAAITSNNVINIASKTSTTTEGYYLKEKMLIDLTQWFNGNQTILDSITTPEDAYALGVPRTYIPYNEGEIISADCDEVVSEGKNLWNDVLEIGSIGATGVNIESENQYRQKNYTEINPNTTYTTRAKNNNVGNLVANFYDENKTFISRVFVSTFTSPSNAKYIRLRTDAVESVDLTNLFQIEKGSTSTPYSPYGIKGQMEISAALRTFLKLHGYGISARSAYNSINFNEKVYEENVKRKSFSDLTFSANLTNIGGFSTQSLTDRKIGSRYMLTDEFTIIPNWWGWSNFDSYENMSFGCTVSSATVFFKNTNCTTLAEWNAATANDHIQYEIETPNYYYDPTSPLLAANGGSIIPDFTMTSASDTIPSTAHHIVLWDELFPANTIMNAEAGGSITFHQDGDTEFPVPNSTTYLVNTDAAAQS